MGTWNIPWHYYFSFKVSECVISKSRYFLTLMRTFEGHHREQDLQDFSVFSLLHIYELLFKWDYL